VVAVANPSALATLGMPAVDGDHPALYLEQEGGGRYQPTDGAVLVRQITNLSHRPLLVILASCRGAGDDHATLAAIGPQLARADGAGVARRVMFPRVTGDMDEPSLRTSRGPPVSLRSQVTGMNPACAHHVAWKNCR